MTVPHSECQADICDDGWRPTPATFKEPPPMTDTSAIARIFANWMNPQYMRLHAGEMTAQEVRSVRAIVDCIRSEIDALLPHSHCDARTASDPVACKLDWQETFVERGDGSRDSSGWEVDSGFGPWYVIDQYFGSDSYGWELSFDSMPMGNFDDPDIAKKTAQDDFERRIKSALSQPHQDHHHQIDKTSIHNAAIKSVLTILSNFTGDHSRPVCDVAGDIRERVKGLVVAAHYRPEEITKAEMDAIEQAAIAGRPLSSTERS